MDYPKISIITPTYNQGSYLEQTILSIIRQNYPNLEYIIIDGGSNDETVNIIRKYEKYLKFWISEKDYGQGNAINKGLHHCTGEIFNWVNSDDYLEKDSLYKIAAAFKPGVQMVAGRVRLFESSDTIEIVQNQFLSAKGLMYWLKDVKFVQPGVWLLKDLFIGAGGIDESLHFAFDWDLYIRYLSKFPKVVYINDILVHFRYHAESKTLKERANFTKEEDVIINKMANTSSNLYLKKLATKRQTGRKWFLFLQVIRSDSSKNKINKIMTVLSNINKENVPHIRVTLGFIKQLIIG